MVDKKREFVWTSSKLMKVPELLWIFNFSESYQEERIPIYMLVKQILGTKGKKGAVWLMQLLNAAILL